MIDWQGNPKKSEIPSDLYYSCLNGTWDSDEDYIYGESTINSIEDEADWHAEVYVGRAPVETSYEASVFVNKIISFETSEKPNGIQLHQSGLNAENNPTSSKLIQNCEQWIPKDNFTINRFYSIFQNITPEKWIQSFNDGKLIIQHAGNGDLHQYDLDNIKDNEVWSEKNISQLRNNFYPIHLSLSCNSGDFTVNDCIAEKMLLYPYGGISACIFNSDLGATDSQDVCRYSGEYLSQQFYEIFENKTSHLGIIHQKAKEFFASQARINPKYRWCYYTLNLLGDPETPVFEQRSCESNVLLSVDDDFTPRSPGWNTTRFNSIQSAINNVEKGGTILVYNGNYFEDILISKSVYIYGTNRNFEDNTPYSGQTTITGSGANHVVTITADNVFLDGFIIKNSGSTHAGLYLKNMNDTFIYRNNIVSNDGNGIFMESCTNCAFYDCSISFNAKNGLRLHDSHHNTFEGLEIAYNTKNGMYLNQSHNNQISGQSSSWQSPLDFYGPKILLKNQQLNLSQLKDVQTFIKMLSSEISQDMLEQFFYFPLHPPESTENFHTTEYFYMVNNENGITIEQSYNNTIENLWIETKKEGVGIQLLNSSLYPNYITSNFIYKNNIGIKAINSIISRIYFNNIYNNVNSISFFNCSGFSLSNQFKPSFILGGNIILHDKDSNAQFQWLFLDKSNNALFIDAITLSLIFGHITTGLILTIIFTVSKIYPIPFITTFFSSLFFLSTLSPFMLKYIKMLMPDPSNPFGI